MKLAFEDKSFVTFFERMWADMKCDYYEEWE